MASFLPNIESTTKSVAKKIPSPKPARKSPPDTFTMYLGTQRKHKYTINLLKGDIDDFIVSLYAGSKEEANSSSAAALTVHDDGDEPNSENDFNDPYSPALSGMILLTDPNLTLQSKTYQHLLKVCNVSSEFHFPSVEEQFAGLVKKVQHQATGLETGDFVVTKHSNLQNAQVIFHLAVKKENCT